MTMPHLMNCPHKAGSWCLDCVGQLHAYAEALNSRCIADAQDAERYRWLRDKAPGEIVFDHTHRKSDGGSRFVLLVPFDGEPIDNDAESAARLNASIDAAMVPKRDGAA